MCGRLSHSIAGLENSLSPSALFVVEILIGCSRTPRSWHARFYLTESTSKTAEQRSRDSLSGDRLILPRYSIGLLCILAVKRQMCIGIAFKMPSMYSLRMVLLMES